MGRASDDATARSRVLLASAVAAGLAILAPSFLLTAVDAPSTVSLAVVTLVLAALVRFGDHGAVLAARTVITGPPTALETAPVLTGRITDPVHHPLRPRAPGSA
jgi:hypothetical protein